MQFVRERYQNYQRCHYCGFQEGFSSDSEVGLCLEHWTRSCVQYFRNLVPGRVSIKVNLIFDANHSYVLL